MHVNKVFIFQGEFQDIPVERSDYKGESDLNLTAEDEDTEENKKQPISTIVISLIDEFSDMTQENDSSSWNIYNEYLIKEFVDTYKVFRNDAVRRSEAEMIWANLGFSFEYPYTFFRDFQKVYNGHNEAHNHAMFAKLLLHSIKERKLDVPHNISLRSSIDLLLNFLQFQISNTSGDVDLTDKIIQVDGTSDISKTVPKCLGNLDCSQSYLFHALSLFRGFNEVFPSFYHHPLCDYRGSNYCVLCLIRSFTYRINDMRLSYLC